MKKYLSIFLFVALWPTISLQAQNYSLKRGHGSNDLYVYCYRGLTFDAGHPIMLYRLTDYASHITPRYTVYYNQPNDYNLKNFVADPTPGLMYCTSLSNNQFPVYRSLDYGSSWDTVMLPFNYYTPPSALLGGAVAGEVIMPVRPGSLFAIDRTMDGFATLERMRSDIPYFLKPEPGSVAGEMFGLHNNYSSPFDFVLYSIDYGMNIDTLRIDSTVVYNPNGQEAVKLAHGAGVGEVYLLAKGPEDNPDKPNHYSIYHSSNHGLSFEWKSEFRFDNNSLATDLSAGREPCLLYFANWRYLSALQLVYLDIYVSHDCGTSFQVIPYLLDFDVNLPEAPQLQGQKWHFVNNPVHTEVSIQMDVPATGPLQFQLSSVQGAKIWFKEMSEIREWGSQTRFDLPALSAGVYVGTIISGGQSLGTQKLIVK